MLILGGAARQLGNNGDSYEKQVPSSVRLMRATVLIQTAYFPLKLAALAEWIIMECYFRVVRVCTQSTIQWALCDGSGGFSFPI